MKFQNKTCFATSSKKNFVVALIASICICLSVVTGVYAIENNDGNLNTSFQELENSKDVVRFKEANENSESSNLEVTFTKEDYQVLIDNGYNLCGENTEFTLDGCKCEVGYSGNGFVCNKVETTYYDNGGYTFTQSSYQSVTTDTSGYYGDSAIANAALSLVGAYGYYCYDVVTYALSQAGFSGSYLNGTQVSLSELQPGDIIVYPSHYSVYVGNGKAVHGGYSGLNVILGDVVVGKIPYTAYRCQ